MAILSAPHLRFPCVALFSSLLASSGLSQISIDEVFRQVKSQRESVKPYFARVTEEVDNLGPDQPLDRGSLSWGDRDGSRLVEVRFKDGVFKFDTDSYYGANTNGLPPLEKSWRLKEGRLETSEPTLKMGEVVKADSIEFLLPAFNYWIDGQPLDAWLGSIEKPVVTQPGGMILVQGDLRRSQVSLFLDPNNRYAISRLVMGANREVDFRVLKWDASLGSPIPSEVVLDAKVGSGQTRNTYALTSLERLINDKDMSLDWPEGTRVYDRIDDRILKVVDGELVGDPVFDKSTRRKKSNTSAVFLIAGFVAILSLVILGLRMARRRTS